MVGFDYNKYYDFLNDIVGISTDALDLAFGLNGCNYQTAKDILFYETGYDDFKSFCEDEEIKADF